MGLKGMLGKVMIGKNVQASATNDPSATPVPPVVPARPPWDASRFRIQLKLAKSRIEIQHGKKENDVSNTRQVIAEHLRNNKETLARIHAERVLRETILIQAFDVVHTFIELLINSYTVFDVQNDFHSAGTDIKESVASVVYASSRMNIPELHAIRNMFRAHFGAGIVDPITRLEGPFISHINPMLARNLEGGAPDGYLILQELTKIASDYNVSWAPPPEFNDLDGRAPGDIGYYRPVPFPQTGGGPHNPSAPPPPDYGGGAYAPTNIPGHNPYLPAAPFGDIPGLGPMMPPSGQPSAPPPAPYDPSDNAPGTLYPSAPPRAGAHEGSILPPPPPPANFLNDDDLESRFRNIRGGN